MFIKRLKYFVSLIILFHCLGVTQLVSAYSKDGSTFTTMLSMTEEETKKEKDCKEDDTENSEALKYRQVFIQAPSFEACKLKSFFNAKTRLTDQYLAERPSPPPDQLV